MTEKICVADIGGSIRDALCGTATGPQAMAKALDGVSALVKRIRELEKSNDTVVNLLDELNIRWDRVRKDNEKLAEMVAGSKAVEKAMESGAWDVFMAALEVYFEKRTAEE